MVHAGVVDTNVDDILIFLSSTKVVIKISNEDRLGMRVRQVCFRNLAARMNASSVLKNIQPRILAEGRRSEENRSTSEDDSANGPVSRSQIA